MVVGGVPKVVALGEPHDVEIGEPVNCKLPTVGVGKVWLKVKPVN
jgi:hypothetical protein